MNYGLWSVAYHVTCPKSHSTPSGDSTNTPCSSLVDHWANCAIGSRFVPHTKWHSRSAADSQPPCALFSLPPKGESASTARLSNHSGILVSQTKVSPTTLFEHRLLGPKACSRILLLAQRQSISWRKSMWYIPRYLCDEYRRYKTDTFDSSREKFSTFLGFWLASTRVAKVRKLWANGARPHLLAISIERTEKSA
jgi:hypothetical protein